jgi:arylsulfatase A-like enzyme
MVMADQLRADALAPFANGRKTAHTPVLDELASRSAVFTDAHVQHPVCGPSRVSMMTGWYPHVHGHRTLTNLLKPWHPNLLQLVRSAGYNVCFAGRRGDVFAPGVTEMSTDVCGWLTKPKHRFTPSPFAPGSAEWSAMLIGKRTHDTNDGPVLDFDEACIRTAEQWLADQPRGPWMLFVPLLFPHPPFEVEDPWFSLHTPNDVPSMQAPMTGKPQFHEVLRREKHYDELTPESWNLLQRTYFGMTARVDAQLGRVLAAVERTGTSANTVTVFCSDHGEYAGDFGLVEKWPSGLDRCLTRTPLIIHDPNASATVVASPVEAIDVFATIIERTEADVRHTHFGRSLSTLIDGSSSSVRAAAVTEGGFRVGDVDLLEEPIPGPYEAKARLQRERPELVGLGIAFRTSTHTYVHRHEEPSELYDRVNDPEETTNLIDDPTFATHRADLERALLHWLVETSDVIEWERDPRFPDVPDGYRTDAEL